MDPAPLVLGSSEILEPFNFDICCKPCCGDNDGSSSHAHNVSAVANAQVDWKETQDCHIFKANLPGLARDDVKVQVGDGGVLQISGERMKEETAPGEKWHQVERPQGGFLRRFCLPENAKAEEVTASMELGVLTVTVPKGAKPEAAATIDVGVTQNGSAATHQNAEGEKLG